MSKTYAYRVSKQTISTAKRHAIWLAHDQKCSYCSRPLHFGDLDIDHIIPEAIGSNTIKFTQLRADLGLPEDFDCFSFSNMLPAHRSCNRTKSEAVFNTAGLLLYLGQATKAAPRIIAMLSETQTKNKRETALAYLADSIQRGEIMLKDFMPQTEPDTLTLANPIVFVDGEESTIAPDQIEQFLDRPVLIGSVPDFTVKFGNDAGVKMHVHTCREYRAAIAAGYYTRTNTDMKLEPFLRKVDSVLRAAETVRIPTLSYISRPFRGVADLDLLPIEIMPGHSPEEREEIRQLAGKTVGDLLRKGEVKILNTSSYEVSMEWHMGLLVREICRADLDGDGIEDMLCECYSWALGGTLGFGWISLLSRKSADGSYTIHSTA